MNDPAERLLGRRWLRRVVSGTALALGLAGAVPAAAWADQTYWVPADRSFTLDGHGYGHGRGMSQWGAYGAAKAGLDWREIIGFYYPGTTLGTARGLIRVLITADTSRNVTVRARSGLRLRDLGSSRSWDLPVPSASTDLWELRINRDNVNYVVYHDNGGWHRWRVPGQGTLRGDAEFSAPGPIGLVTPSGTRQYRGTLRMVKVGGASSSDRNTVNVVGLESYVQGVVPSEMPASWDSDAVAAQAVAARTYAVRHRSANASRYFNVDDTISYQVYGGFGVEDPRSNAAVRNTRGTIVTYGGQPALTEFSSSSGGWTAGSDLPYQRYQRDPYDAPSGNPNHDWSTSAGVGALEASYPSIGRLQWIIVTDSPGGGEWGGRVGHATLVGTRGRTQLTGDDLRRIYGLKSNWFRPRSTDIIRLWRRLGGWSSPLGRPLAAEYVTAGGVGQRFEEGRAYDSSATGAHAVYGEIYSTYARFRGASGFLGFPRSNVVDAGANSKRTDFQNGKIYYRADIGAHEIHGPIYKAWARTGWSRGFLGLPTSNVVDAGANSKRTDFQNGKIYYRADIGAHEIHGPIYKAWARTGWSRGFLGLPTSDVVDAGAEGSVRSNFEHGIIYHRSDVGAHEIHDPMIRPYARHGGAAGELGLPTSDVYEVPGGLRIDFQHGWITWDSATDTTRTHVG